MSTTEARFRIRRLARRSFMGVRLVLDTAVDSLRAIRGGRDPMVPPVRLQFVGQGDYREIGQHVLQLLVDVAGLKRDEQILDVGCGSGRVALALLDHLDENGSYEGFDVSADGIDWATRTISKRNPMFRFQVADVQNDHYNRMGALPATEYRFPYTDATFDLALATSVFTHMRAPEVRHYLAEIGRVLRPRGRLLMTFYLLNDQSRAAIEEGAAELSFRYGSGTERFEYRDRLVEGVAYNETDVRRWLEDVGLRVVDPIHNGAWAQAPAPLSFQDVVLAVKPG